MESGESLDYGVDKRQKGKGNNGTLDQIDVNSTRLDRLDRRDESERMAAKMIAKYKASVMERGGDCEFCHGWDL